MIIVSVIPARGKSKSIPKKNIYPLNGVPLIKYSIDYSLKSKLISHTFVSSDSKEIGDLSINFGAQFLERPEELSEDHVRDFPVIHHALLNLEKKLNLKIDIIILLRPTSPLRPANLIERGIDLINLYPESTSVRAVTKSKEHPYRQWKKNSIFIEPFYSKKNINVNEPYNIPRQELIDSYFQTGDIEIIRRETIIKGSISGDKILPIYINQNEVHDIDEKNDIANAEAYIKKND